MNARKEMLQNAGIVAIGGALGTLLRLAVQSVPLGASAELSVLVAINVVGSFALGYALLAKFSRESRRQLLIAPGILGGFTTYSAFTYAAYNGFSSGAMLETLIFVGISLCGGVCGAVLGARLGGQA